jgi:hypothetical protein
MLVREYEGAHLVAPEHLLPRMIDARNRDPFSRVGFRGLLRVDEDMGIGAEEDARAARPDGMAPLAEEIGIRGCDFDTVEHHIAEPC